MYDLAGRLFPICRSITGDGVRETLRILQEYIPLTIEEVPTGTQVFDWTVPREWNIRDAWIKNGAGDKIIDFKENNLHILNYSIPFTGKLNLTQLKEHLYTIPSRPDAIPYRTSYYSENWGFCLSHTQFENLKADEYEVLIDSSLTPGYLTYGELLIPGESEDEFLLSTHICHPSLANDNLSGITLLVHLAKFLFQKKNRFSYRLLFIPGTIGSITWLAQNESRLKKIKAGLVASLVGDPASFNFKKSRSGNTILDQVVEYVLANNGFPYNIHDFYPYGYDERQYCSPGINLSVGNLTRSTFGYAEYHTSDDNMTFITSEALDQSFHLYRSILEVWEQNISYLNLFPMGEPQLGKRGLYEAVGGQSDSHQLQMAMLWILNLSDSKHSLMDIAKKSGIPLTQLDKMAHLLTDKNLIKPLQ